VDISRKVNPFRIVVNGRATIKLTIINKGKKIDNIEIYDKLPTDVTLSKGTNHLILSIKPKETITFTYEITCPYRGKYDLGPSTIRVKDPIGFQYKTKTQCSPFTLYVVPEIERPKPSDLKTNYTGRWPGFFHSKQKGFGTEFYELRDYVPGDPLRHVNWKASARMSKLITVEYESERSSDIVIILDGGRGATLGTYPDTVIEHGIRATGSIALLLLNMGNRVGLVVHGKEERVIETNFGKHHFQKILNYLAMIKPGYSNIPIGYRIPRSTIKPKIIFISPLLGVNIVRDLKNLAIEGYSILVISPSFMKLIDQIESEAESRRISYRILALERANIIIELKKFGKTVDWNPKLSLRSSLKVRKKWKMTARI